MKRCIGWLLMTIPVLAYGQAGGVPALQADLAKEALERAAGDAALQTAINNVATTQGPPAFVGRPQFDPIPLPGGGQEVIVSSLNLGPGSYVVFAKVLVYNQANSIGVVVTCLLYSGSSLDRSDTFLTAGTFTLSVPGSLQTIPLQTAITLGDSRTIALVCVNPEPQADAFAQFPQMTAVRVGSLTSQP